jgi:hypothetical protein
MIFAGDMIQRRDLIDFPCRNRRVVMSEIKSNRELFNAFIQSHPDFGLRVRTIIDVISNANGDMTLIDGDDERMVQEFHKLGKSSINTWDEDREKTTEQADEFRREDSRPFRAGAGLACPQKSPGKQRSQELPRPSKHRTSCKISGRIIRPRFKPDTSILVT